VNRRRSITWAFLASLLCHVIVGLATWNVDLFGVDEAAAPQDRPDDVVEVIFEPEAADESDPGRPREFTSVPERQAVEEPPSRADFLAMHNSRAADELEGGTESSSPGAERTSEVEQVAISADSGASEGGMALIRAPEYRTGEGETPTEGDEDLAADPRGSDAPELQDGDVMSGDFEADEREPAEEQETGSAATSPDILESFATAEPSILAEGTSRSGDPGFDYDQMAISSSAGNMIQFGEFRLNTLSWDFAPWLERFKQDFLPHWIPPYAYRLGVIDGRTIMRLEVQRDGTIGGLDVLEEEGHPSLHQASTAALHGAAPFAPLPPDFPEETLVIELGLLYPTLEEMQRPARTREPTERRRRPRSPLD
jgi:hypothetical protein